MWCTASVTGHLLTYKYPLCVTQPRVDSSHPPGSSSSTCWHIRSYRIANSASGLNHFHFFVALRLGAGLLNWRLTPHLMMTPALHRAYPADIVWSDDINLPMKMTINSTRLKSMS